MEGNPKMMKMNKLGLDYKATMDNGVRAKVQDDTLGANVYLALISVYKLIAKEREIKVDQNSTKPPPKT